MKLQYENNEYYLMVDGEDLAIATTDESFSKEIGAERLSRKNCEEIKNGYDINELATKNAFKDLINGGYDGLINPHTKMLIDVSYMNGFQKALEILGDSETSSSETSSSETSSSETSSSETSSKKFSEEQLKNSLLEFITEVSCEDGKLISKTPFEAYDWIENHVQSLQKTEWDVEIEMCKTSLDELLPKLDEDGFLILKKI